MGSYSTSYIHGMKNILISMFLLLLLPIYGQVGIGTDTPDASSILELSSSNKGVLFPRIALTNTTTASPVTAPATGLLIFNTSTVADVLPGFYYWNGSAWKALTASGGSDGSSGSWNLTGNIISDSDFLGTLQDYKPLNFKINGNNFGQFHPQGGISIGLNSVTSNDHGIAIGTSSQAGTSNSIAIGHTASASGSNLSVAIGMEADVSNHQSTALGYKAKTGGHSAVALGSEASAGGLGSTALGRETSASGQYSTAIGYGATVSQANTIRIGNSDARIGIGTSTPASSAILEIQSNNKGILIPRVALSGTNDQSNITNPVESLLVYNTRTTSDVVPGFYYWGGSTWKALAGSGGGSSGTKTFGERYLDSDPTIELSQYNQVNSMPTGVVNPVSTFDLTPVNNGFTIGAGAAGTYKVTLTVTYSKAATTGVNNEVEFFLTLWGNAIAGTSLKVDLNDDLRKRTVTITKLLSLSNDQNYGWGIGKSDSGTPSIKLYKDLTNFTLQRMD